MPTTKSAKKPKKGLKGVAAERTKKASAEKAKDHFVQEAVGRSAANDTEAPNEVTSAAKKGFSVNLPVPLIQRFNKLRGELDAEYPGDRPDRGDLVQVALEELLALLEYNGEDKHQTQAKERCLARAMELRLQTKRAIYGSRSSS